MTKDHWTFPEDPETKAGWGPFNFNFIMKPFKEAVAWHDRITTEGNFAERAGIPNWRVAKAWRDMLEEMSKAIPGAGITKRTAWGAGFLVAVLNRHFYEGPLGEEPKIKQDKDSGEMY